MIRQLTDAGSVRFGEDYYSGRINAYITAYGTGYDFCRLYKAGNGYGLIYNASAVFAGDIGDTDELEKFIGLCAPETIEIPPKIKISPEGYEKRHRIMFEMSPRPTEHEDMITDKVSLEAMYRVISESFGYAEYDLWYTDMSHRIRHGITRAYMCGENACAAVDFIRRGRGYISQVATLPEARGRGYARGLLGHIAAELEKSGIRGYLWAYDELGDFYRGLGFAERGEDTVYIREQET